MAVWFFANFNVPLTNDYPVSRVDCFDLSLKSWERGSDTANIFKVLWFTVHPAFWMSQTRFMLDKSVLPVHTRVLYSNLHSKTKQMAATSISCSDFEKTKAHLLAYFPWNSAIQVLYKVWGVFKGRWEKKKQYFWQYFVIFHEIKSKFMHRKRSFWQVLHVRQPLPTILTLTSWTALVHICTTLSNFVRKELKVFLDL